MAVYSRVDWLTLTAPVEYLIEGLPLDMMRADFSHLKMMANEMVERFTHRSCDVKASLARPPRFMATYLDEETCISVSYPFKADGVVMMVVPGSFFAKYEFGEKQIDAIVADGWRVRRVDVALDICDGGYPVVQLAVENTPRRSEGDKRKYSFISSKNGDTFTLGSRLSGKYLRIYDKAKQLDLDTDWVRVELEMKGDVADAWQATGYTHGFAFKTLLAMLKNKEGFLVKYLEEALTAWMDVPDTTIGRKITNTELWFEQQVKPCLKKLAIHEPLKYARVSASLKKFMDDWSNQIPF